MKGIGAVFVASSCSQVWVCFYFLVGSAAKSFALLALHPPPLSSHHRSGAHPLPPPLDLSLDFHLGLYYLFIFTIFSSWSFPSQPFSQRSV